jgi:uncharacterized protein YuzE
MSNNTITIGDTTFDRIEYDRDADVLYLSVGEPQPAAHTYGTPEGHAVRFDANDNIVGITLVNAKHLLERDELVVTVPHTVDVRRDELELALN